MINRHHGGLQSAWRGVLASCDDCHPPRSVAAPRPSSHGWQPLPDCQAVIDVIG